MKRIIVAGFLSVCIVQQTTAKQIIRDDEGHTWTVYEDGERDLLGGSKENPNAKPTTYADLEQSMRTLGWEHPSISDDGKPPAANPQKIGKAISAHKGNSGDETMRKKFGVNGDSTSYYVDCDGQGWANGVKCSPKLWIRYKAGRYEVFAHFGTNVFLQGIGDCFCGCGKEFGGHNDKWSSSTDGQSAFYGGDVVALINELGKHPNFAIVITVANGTQCFAEFKGVNKKVKGFIRYTNSK